MSRNWSEKENFHTVEDYFQMLLEEARGNDYVKAEYRRSLLLDLDNRSEGAIEYKHQNISAVLFEVGLPYIEGYKPASNYQESLKEVVHAYLRNNRETVDKLLHAAETAAPEEKHLSHLERVDPPESLDGSAPRPGQSVVQEPRHYPYAEIERKNRKLGELGEQAVMSYERKRLQLANRGDLADHIKWVSRDEGDGAGYDILSYDLSGGERFIEVKTTKHGIYFPFHLTRNELKFSEEQTSQYSLYRLFSFRHKPKLYQCDGDIRHWTSLQATNYRAYIR